MPSTANLADAAVQLKIRILVAPFGIHPIAEGCRASGRVLPVRHSGSVDIFLEAMAQAKPGDVLVVDNGGRLDEGCIGDMVALEAKLYRLGGVVIWGAHRDTNDLREIGLPLFSYGCWPVGPTRAGAQRGSLGKANFGDFCVDARFQVLADADGVVFYHARDAAKLLATATCIAEQEQKQRRRMLRGDTLHEQLQFDEYLRRRKSNRALTFRKHLRERLVAVET